MTNTNTSLSNTEYMRLVDRMAAGKSISAKEMAACEEFAKKSIVNSISVSSAKRKHGKFMVHPKG